MCHGPNPFSGQQFGRLPRLNESLVLAGAKADAMLRAAALASLLAEGSAKRKKSVFAPSPIEVSDERIEPSPQAAESKDAPWHKRLLTKSEEVALHEAEAELMGRGSRMRVAWAGNSLTFWNDLPALLEEFADADRGGPSSLAIATCVRAGASLSSLSDEGCGQALSQGIHGAKPPDVQSMLQPTHSGWDAVVLQDHSSRAVRPHLRVETQLSLRQTYAPLLLKAGWHGAPCRTLLLQTWGYLRAVRGSQELGKFGKHHFEKMNELSIEGHDAYRTTLEQAGLPAEVVPVGEAWQLVARERRHLFSSLYSMDGVNPGWAGTYLIAATLYATLSGRDPRPLTVAACGRRTNLPCHAELSEADLSYLRDVAARATTRGTGRALQISIEPPPTQLRDLHPDL